MNDCMRGCITECNFDEAELCFPGIAAFYKAMAKKPPTFLELVWAFLDAGYVCTDAADATDFHDEQRRVCLR